jgi:hypothetical protein
LAELWARERSESCTYEAKREDQTITVKVDLTTDPPTDKTKFDSDHQGDEAAPGVGDAAYFITGAEGEGIAILTDTAIITVTVSSPTPVSAAKQRAGVLGKKAVERYKTAAE